MPDPTTTTEPHDSYAALRDRNYRRYAIGFVSAATGLQALATAVGWEIYERTGDPMDLGYTGLARALPVVVFALVGGHLADILERRFLIAASQVGFAVCATMLAGLSLAKGPIWVIYFVLVLMGCCRAFNGPARGSFLPTIVPGPVFPNAVAWTSACFQFASIAGPLLAGAMLHTTRVAWPVYAMCVVGNLLFAANVLAIRPAPPTAAPSRPANNQTIDAIFQGLSHLWRERTILAAITLDLFGVLLGGATALLPIYAKDILGEGPRVLGALRAAPYIGAFIMGVYIAHRPAMKKAGPSLLWAVVGFGVGTIVFGLSTNLWLSLAALFVAGAADNISVVVRHVLVQVRTPDHLRGRVGAVNSVFIECSNELGAFESGWVASKFGAVISVVSGGIGTIIVAGITAVVFPELRKLGELKESSVNGQTPAAPPEQLPPPEAGPPTQLTSAS